MALTFTPGISDVVGTASQLSGALTDPATATQGGTGLTSLAAGYIPKPIKGRHYVSHVG